MTLASLKPCLLRCCILRTHGAIIFWILVDLIFWIFFCSRSLCSAVEELSAEELEALLPTMNKGRGIFILSFPGALQISIFSSYAQGFPCHKFGLVFYWRYYSLRFANSLL